MKITDFSVKNYQFTIVVFLMMIAIGWTALQSIPKSEDPNFPVPRFAVVTVYPGASPTDIEQIIVDPIEDALGELDDIKTIKTSINDGYCSVDIEFESDQDPDEKYNDVLRQLGTIQNVLPDGILRQEVIQFNSSNVNVWVQVLVSENQPYPVLKQLAERLEETYEKVPDVKKAEVFAEADQEVRVAVDLDRLAQRRIPLTTVLGALQAGNTNIPGGAVDIGSRKYNIKTSGDYESVEQLANTVVAGDGRSIVRLKDVADIRMRLAEQTYSARYNGQRAVMVGVQLKDNQNIFEAVKRLDAEKAAFAATLPPGVTLYTGFDQSANVSHRLEGFTRDFILAIILVLITLLPLGTRASLIVMVSIPLSLAMGLAFIQWLGFSINQLSIVGFVIALGLLVDDSIVIIENIARYIRAGYKPLQAATAATRQIGLAVIGTTATLIFAFLPLMFLPGTAGMYIRSLPVAVISTILASLFVSFTIIPFLSSRFLKNEGHEGNFFLRWLERSVHVTYGPVLHRALARPYITLVVALLLFVGSMLLIPAVGFSLFPKAGMRQFIVQIETPEGSSLAETQKAAQYVERILADKPQVEWQLANVGNATPRVYYNLVPRAEAANVADILVQLNDYSAVQDTFYDALRERFAAYPNADIKLKEFENGPPIDAPIAFRILGDNLDTLKSLASKVQTILEKTEGTQYIDNPLADVKTDLRVNIDRDKAGMLGVLPVEMNRTVRMAIAGLPATTFRDADGEEYDVLVTTTRTGPDNRQTLNALDRVFVTNTQGTPVPLNQIASLQFEQGPTQINHYDKQRSVTVGSFVRTGYNTNRLTNQALEQINQLQLPVGYRIITAGEVESSNESFGGMGTAIIVAVFGIFAILVLEFGTFKSTLIVISVIPLGIIGGILALYFTGYTLSFTATIGFVALIGIEIKNSILLVDFTNQLRARGMPLIEAIEKAGEVRFIPIVLTTLTALGGLIPLALENSALYSPLAVVIIGGLITSTILTRIVTPVMYKLLPPKVEVGSLSEEDFGPDDHNSGSHGNTNGHSPNTVPAPQPVHV